jgi:uncharacterized coiled-coil protein SlyX
MHQRLEQRLTELRKEFQEGQRVISELESKLASVRATVLRISGAIQVLEEELSLSETDRSPTQSEAPATRTESLKVAHAG